MQYGRDLYEKLIQLTKESEAFYFSDAPLHGVQYRIFNYRIASYTEFTKPGALECRGHMFQVDGESFVRLVSLPMEKFFNLNENPFTEGWNLSDQSLIKSVTKKEDGSLISTFWQDHLNDTGVAGMYFKTKGSLVSKQCGDAWQWARRNTTFFDALSLLTQFGATVNMEWTSPDNRVVVGYIRPRLTILNVRDTRTGQYLSKQWVSLKYPALSQHWVEDGNLGGLDIEKIRQMTGIEGFVVELQDGRKAKMKTDWYVALHKTKESVDSDKKLFETIILGAQDDLKAMFHDNEHVIGKIKAMEELVIPKFRKTVRDVEDFYQTNRLLDRKQYAILAQGTMGNLMGLAMNKYLGREANYEEWAIKYSDQYISGFYHELPSES